MGAREGEEAELKGKKKGGEEGREAFRGVLPRFLISIGLGVEIGQGFSPRFACNWAKFERAFWGVGQGPVHAAFQGSREFRDTSQNFY